MLPDIPTVAGGRVLTAVQANTTAARTFPNLSSLTKNAGDLLVAIVAGYQSSPASGYFSTWGASFTEFLDVGASTNICIGAAYKWSTGSETGTFTVTQVATITGHAALILMSIPNAHASSPPEGGVYASGTSTAANPGSFAPSWGNQEVLWISVGANGETATGGTFGGLTGSPTNYSGDVESAISADAVGGITLGVGFRQLEAASEDPAAWSLDTSNARNAAALIAVRGFVPPPGPVLPPLSRRRAHRFMTIR